LITDLYRWRSKRQSGAGGYGGCVKIWGPSKKELAEGFSPYDQNRMELLAVSRGAPRIEKVTEFPVQIYFATAKYVVDSAPEDKVWLWGWQKKGLR